jgi:alkylhydroperoxidase/carboxymuconolactone decarboxylase family protein YurZ
MTDTKKRFDAYVEAARKERGYLPPSMLYAASRDIDFIEAYDRLYANSLNDGKAFPAKYRELVCAGVLAFRGFDPGVYEHLKRAIRLGATHQECLEAMEATVVPGGWPTLGSALRALIKIEEEEKAAKSA